MRQHTPFVIEDKTYLLRYGVKQQNEIRDQGPKFLPESKIKKFKSPMDIVPLLDNIDVQTWMIKLGLEWEESGIEKIDFDVAAELRQAYLEQGEPDGGEKLEAFIFLLMDALSLNAIGANGKKLMANGAAKRKEQEDADAKTKVEEYARINEARILAQARAKPKLEAEGLSLGMNGSQPPAKPA
jgi:hypothetical protein